MSDMETQETPAKYEVTLMWFDHETGTPSPEFAVTVTAVSADQAIQVATSIADPDQDEFFKEQMELELRGVRITDAA